MPAQTIPLSSNRLASSSSPYLLQHASNPVDWYPWGPEAFQEAARLDRPLFVSVGYAACHWCHVMNRESFQDPQVAQVLNESFVCVKVDREERPDVDEALMAWCQAMTGGGGWPLTVFMTPGGRPFLAATYLPPRTRQGRIGLVELAQRVSALWRTQRELVLETTKALEDLLGREPTPQDPEPSLPTLVYRELARTFDPSSGGFGHAPKFPCFHIPLFLMEYWSRTGQTWALRMATHTLRSIREGGIYDQVGGGVHRYATDERWLVPHFEKMLPDQAMALVAYTAASQITGDALFEQTVREVVEFMLRELRTGEGAFASSLDAQSDGEEGAYYLWTQEQVEDAVGDDAALVARALGVGVEAARVGEGFVPFRAVPPASLAGRMGLDEEEAARRFQRGMLRLREARSQRNPPPRDDKVLTDWNGLAIAGLARAGAALGMAQALEAARACADFLTARMVSPTAGLWHRFYRGQVGIPGMASDFAALTWGLIELAQATGESSSLDQAVHLFRQMEERFWHPRRGFISSGARDIPPSPPTASDGALPSVNSVALHACLALEALTGEPRYREVAQSLVRIFSSEALRAPAWHAHFASGVWWFLEGGTSIRVTGPPEASLTRGLLAEAHRTFAPGKTVAWVQGAKALAQVCRGSTCLPPATTPGQLRELITGRGPRA